MPLMNFCISTNAQAIAATFSLVMATALLPSKDCRADEPIPSVDSPDYYSQYIQPILSEHCYECHSHASGESNGLLLVDSPAALLSGGTRGASVVPGNLDASLIYQALLYSDPDLQMPPAGKLQDDQIQLFKEWIQAGAVAPQIGSKSDNSHSIKDPSTKLSHWAYQQPLQSIAAKPSSQVIDELLLNRLQFNGLTFSPRADRRTLLKRLAFDLTGLTPTFEELERFANDSSDDQIAIADVVDGLLASPHFGERWARYWMDIARYADTKGYVFQEDRQYAEAFRYRDWLIEAFNRDMPYDQFIRKQLAADLDLDTEGNGIEHIPALGFLTLGRRFLNNKNDIIDDRLDVVTRGLMGMTLACARCHDHKYDPISQADYYALSGIFLNTDEPGGEPFAHRLVDSTDQRSAHILIRGNPGRPGDEVPRRFITLLDAEQKNFGPGSGRIELAEHITSSTNPLTARVMVNRIWMNLMGSSLVDSPSDIGTRCPAPLHQDLLDQMAIDFQQDGWSIKRMIRRIVLSNAYQQQSVANNQHAANAISIDPTNSLYWRMNRRRRDIESLRDGLLAASGQLDGQILGPSVKTDQQPFPKRRTVYAYIDRQDLAGYLRNFDMASPDSHSPSRAYTSVPQQGLFLLNSDFVSEQAAELGNQALLMANTHDQSTASQWLFHKILSRSATPVEETMANEFLEPELSTPEHLIERWICGFGSLNESADQLLSFERLPRFHEGQWAGMTGPPDATIGWCLLRAQGGHPGDGLLHTVVRRWIAPRDGKVRIRATLQHPSDIGDGVRGTLLLDAHKQLGQWTVFNSETRTMVEPFQVAAGQTVDFVTDCLSSPNNDSFNWSARIRYEDEARETFDAEKQFPLPNPPALNAWQMLAQAILASNEFAFVD